ncbi:MAG: hypothetical protein ABDH23_02355 [Endomicrobiia bacterium]
MNRNQKSEKNSIHINNLLKIMFDEHDLKKTKDCPELDVLIDYYLDILPPYKKNKLTQHISSCDYCREEIELMNEDEKFKNSFTEQELEQYNQIAQKFTMEILQRKIKHKIKISTGKNVIEVLKESFLFKPIYDIKSFMKSLNKALPAFAFISTKQEYLLRQTEIKGVKMTLKLTLDENQNLRVDLLFTKDLVPVDGVVVTINKEQKFHSQNGVVTFTLTPANEYDIEISLPDNTSFDFVLDVVEH